MLWTDDVILPEGRLLCIHLKSNSTVDNHVLAARLGMVEFAPDLARMICPAPRSVNLKRSRNKEISEPM